MMKRLDALRVIDDVYADSPLVVTCGATARELASLGSRASHLPLLDSMGLAGAVGLGLALGGAGPVAAIEGDGSMLMGLSTLASIAYHRPPGLALIILDNGEHASAAGLPTQAAALDLAALCRGAGLETDDVASSDELGAVLSAIHSTRPPAVAVVVRIEGGNAPDIPLLLADPVELAVRFAAFLKEKHEATIRS
jgi:sulfopyruvate decarboxylase subunit beta